MNLYQELDIAWHFSNCKDFKIFAIDLFCGAGGETTGIEEAEINGEKVAKVVICINHDKNAILSHNANHPSCLHFTEDIRNFDMNTAIFVVKQIRKWHSKSKILLHASLECTNFSKAKGGCSRDADSRTLAEHLFRYIEAINPDYIQIENVEEFMSWGALDDNGKPFSKLAGTDYIKWVNKVKSYGYNFEFRVLNAANFGALTSRKRFFGQFAKENLKFNWPEPTHSKSPTEDLFGKKTKKWKAVKEALDFKDEGNSIFNRKKPLVEATLSRIYAGLIKFVAGGQKSFISRYNTVDSQYTCKSIDEPCGVLTTNNRFAKIECSFLSKQYSGHPEHKNISIDCPAGTITTIDHHQKVNVEFFQCYYGNGDNVSSVESPCPVITTKDRIAVVSAFIMNQYSAGGVVSDINKPSPAVMTNPKQNLVTVRPWIMNTNFNNVGSGIEEPAQTITANRKWHYLMNPQFSSPGGSIEKPCFTLIARMDKMPPYLIQTETGEMAIEIYDQDSPMTKKIKEFMALYCIIDIKMRMLKIPELKKIMGFPENYILIGTQAEQKKYIGNAVEVNMARTLIESLAKII